MWFLYDKINDSDSTVDLDYKSNFLNIFVGVVAYVYT